jgi:hypothetical protein
MTPEERYNRCVRAMRPAVGDKVAAGTCMQAVAASRGLRIGGPAAARPEGNGRIGAPASNGRITRRHPKSRRSGSSSRRNRVTGMNHRH